MLLLPWRHSGNAYVSRQCLKRRGTQLLTATSFIWGTLWWQLIITKAQTITLAKQMVSIFDEVEIVHNCTVGLLLLLCTDCCRKRPSSRLDRATENAGQSQVQGPDSLGFSVLAFSASCRKILCCQHKHCCSDNVTTYQCRYHVMMSLMFVLHVTLLVNRRPMMYT